MNTTSIFSPHEIPWYTAFAIIKKFMNKNPVKIKFLQNRVGMKQRGTKEDCKEGFIRTIQLCQKTQ